MLPKQETEFCILQLLAFVLPSQIFSKEYINLLLTGYFFFLGILALCHLMRYVIYPICCYVGGKGVSSFNVLGSI